MHIAMSILAVAALGAASLHAADAISLDGEWSLRYWRQKSAEGAVRDVASVPVDAKSVRATIPGNCELDLVNAGLMPPPEVGMNVREFRALEGYGWLYTREFEVGDVGSRYRLVFDGVVATPGICIAYLFALGLFASIRGASAK